MSKSIKKYFIFIAIAIIALLAFKHFQTNEKSTDALIVGLQSGYPPFELVDSNGKIVGFDIDIAERIAAKLGKNLVLKDMEFDSEILSLKQGKIDLILSGMNITPNRLKEIQLVPYYGDEMTSLSLIFWNEIPEGIQSLEDIPKNFTVSVQSGSVSEIFIRHYPQIKTKSFDGTLAPLMDVKYGKSLANLVEPETAKYLKANHSEIKIINIPLPEEEKIYGFGIGIKKENQELFQQVQQIIHDLKASGELKKLEDKWFKGEK